MTVQTRAALMADILLYLADNTSQDISPADIRQRFVDLLDSASLGAVGSNDNRLLRSDGTGGGQIQGSAVAVDDTGNITAFGGQIAFPATQNASTDANILDDYEEGTWTPGLTFGGGSTGLTYTTRAGYYTKVGNQVSVSGQIVINAKGSSTGNTKLTGLPFACKTGARGSLNAGFVTGMSSLTAGIALGIDSAVSVADVLRPTTSGSSTLTTEANFNNGTEIQCCGSYLTN